MAGAAKGCLLLLGPWPLPSPQRAAGKAAALKGSLLCVAPSLCVGGCVHAAGSCGVLSSAGPWAFLPLVLVLRLLLLSLGDSSQARGRGSWSVAQGPGMTDWVLRPCG